MPGVMLSLPGQSGRFMKLVQYSIVAGITLMLAACNFSLAGDVTPPPGARQEVAASTQPPQSEGPMYPLVAPNPQNGTAIYADKCAACHGETGQGDGPQASQLPNPPAPLGLPDLARQSTPAEWYAIVTNGNMDKFMPPFTSLSDNQRWDVVAYAFSLSTTSEEIALGEELYLDNCADCHGENGKGTGPKAGELATTLPDFTKQDLMAEKSAASLFESITSGVPPEMPAYEGQLGEDERWALTNHIRSLSFSSSASEVAQATPEVETAPVAPGEAISPTAQTGTVSGRVINGSAEEPLSGQTVTLHGFEGMQIVYTQTTTSQDDGFYTFENVEMPPSRVFLTYTEFGDATYASRIASAEAQNTDLSLDITAYETTTDASVLQVDRLHMFFDFSKPDTVQVIELYIITNPTRQTVMPASAGGTVVTFTLPEGASNLQFQDGAIGERYVETPEGFGDTTPVRPGSGEYQVLFAFDMPYDRNLELVQPIGLPVDAAVVMLPEDGVKIKSDMLKDDGSQDVQGFTYQMYSGERLEAGSNLALT
ncbi:MAG: hypothetical protein EHM70_24310, partial [Chloroflexota bacterium]